jgi:hypothetical protein
MSSLEFLDHVPLLFVLRCSLIDLKKLKLNQK